MRRVMMAQELSYHQQKAIEALKLLKAICEKYELTLFLLAGTTLGAVRHKGMIPWDDDIDVGLKYDDWCKIRKILSNELKGTDFTYVDVDTKSGFPRLFGKILYDNRNCVDVFLIAKWTHSKLSSLFHWQIRKSAVEFYKMSLGYKTTFRPTTTNKEKARYYITHTIRRIMYYTIKPFCNSNSFIKLARWNEKYYEDKKSDCYINLYSIYPMKKEMIEKEWIEHTSIVEFEGDYYTTVGNTHRYLTHLYGDYMTPPPVKNRLATHNENFN